MNPLLKSLQPYPFERLRQVLAGVQPPAALSPVNLSIGEPRHPTPALVGAAMMAALGGLAQYPATAGSPALREAIATWLRRRYGLSDLDAGTAVLPVNGSREALFALAQTVIDPRAAAAGRPPIVISPNPFYQIYEGAAVLAGAEPWYLPQSAARGFTCDWAAIPVPILERTALMFVCSPGNPTGHVLSLDDWRTLFALADRHDFILAADECYAEIYFDEERPPLGALEAAQALGRGDYRRLVVFGSLSKRSNCPGLRSGYVAGDAGVIKDFLLYRTYHGSAMSPVVQAASIAAWGDEQHVVENRRLYREKFEAVTPRLAAVLDTGMPDAGFYLWAGVPGGDDVAFARELYRQYNVLCLPGSFLARDASRADPTDGGNPGAGRIRLALVEPLAQCLEGCSRIETFVRQLQSNR